MKLLESEYSLFSIFYNLTSNGTTEVSEIVSQVLTFFELHWKPLENHRPITGQHLLSVAGYQGRKEPTKIV